MRRVAGIIGLAGVVFAGVLLWNNQAVIADSVRLLNYTPPADIAALSKNIGFTDQGRRYFYASHPDIEDRTAFNDHCGSSERGEAVLGCYTNHSIYVYDVTDTRLAGVREVTAAHETLHAAYDRLSGDDRSSVNAMLSHEYDRLSGDSVFAERFSVYNSLSTEDKLNELHSIFGTEVASLSPELETYYKRYFTDRSIVTGDYAKYQGPFNALKDQQAALKTQIENLKTDISTSKNQYVKDRQVLDSDIQAFNQRSNSGGYSSQAQFNSDRSALAARSDALNDEGDLTNSKIDDYNAKINQYNSLSIQTDDLQNSLNSQSVQAAPAV